MRLEASEVLAACARVNADLLAEMVEEFGADVIVEAWRSFETDVRRGVYGPGVTAEGAAKLFLKEVSE
jgi:hypothetical protein